VFFSNGRRGTEERSDFHSEVVRETHVSIPYRRFKRWYLGQALPIADVVNAICVLSGQELTSLNVTFKEPNWGRKEGGYAKVAIRGCNLTMSDRIRGGRFAGGSNSIDHLRRIASLSGTSLIKNNRNPGRRVLGPNGVRMFNYLRETPCW
jgi:hypothetical protein